MNGRMYDPVLGRMLSPDNYISDAGFTQDYNGAAKAGIPTRETIRWFIMIRMGIFGTL